MGQIKCRPTDKENSFVSKYQSFYLLYRSIRTLTQLVTTNKPTNSANHTHTHTHTSESTTCRAAALTLWRLPLSNEMGPGTWWGECWLSSQPTLCRKPCGCFTLFTARRSEEDIEKQESATEQMADRERAREIMAWWKWKSKRAVIRRRETDICVCVCVCVE